MTDWRIREARETDAGAIAAIINHEIRTGLAIWRYAERPVEDIRAMIAGRLAAGQAVLVAEDGTGVRGWGGYGPFRTGEGYDRTAEHSVHIAPDAQRLGIGRALLEQLIAHAARAGVHALIGGIDDTNTGSIALHRQMGFFEVGRLPEVGWKFDRWLNLVLMQKTL